MTVVQKNIKYFPFEFCDYTNYDEIIIFYKRKIKIL